jgi:hypothetical protein
MTFKEQMVPALNLKLSPLGKVDLNSSLLVARRQCMQALLEVVPCNSQNLMCNSCRLVQFQVQLWDLVRVITVSLPALLILISQVKTQ